MQNIKDFAQRNESELLELLKQLCAIPAPSGLEQERAAFCKNWLAGIGAEGVYIDEALNVIYPLNCEGSDQITVFVAHTDTVFPDLEPMPYVDDGVNVYCPGVGDDTASLCVLLMMAKYYLETGIKPEGGILFVCNSCEEGLGNLKGVRQLFADYAGRIRQFISFDSKLHIVNDECAGSHRYNVEVTTRGGHSFLDFGAPNAIAELSKMVSAIYRIKLPENSGRRTTFNVGGISGGTSVNTIAQSAQMLCEYRSEDKDCLAYMQAQFEKIFADAASDEVKVSVEKIGDRPCSDISRDKIDALMAKVMPIVEDIVKGPITVKSSSTDCNIPLSMGIPALCVGVYNGGGMHTREEWVEKASLKPGLELAIRVARKITEE